MHQNAGFNVMAYFKHLGEDNVLKHHTTSKQRLSAFRQTPSKLSLEDHCLCICGLSVYAKTKHKYSLQCEGDVVDAPMVTGTHQLWLEVFHVVEPINVADRRSDIELQKRKARST